VTWAWAITRLPEQRTRIPTCNLEAEAENAGDAVGTRGSSVFLTPTCCTRRARCTPHVSLYRWKPFLTTDRDNCRCSFCFSKGFQVRHIYCF
jgi:hypothetical protein